MEWKTVKLGDITELVIDYRGKTPLKLGGDWSDRGYRALSAKNIKTGRIVQEESIRFVDEVLYKKWMKDEVKRGDIFITSEAPFGEIYYWDSDEKIVLSQRLFDVRINSKNDSRFVYYFMTTPSFKAKLDGRATGTTVVGLRQPELLKCELPLPPLAEQKRIAAILSSLDAKIENNNRINRNLEAQAQALFQSWFVDFEPWGGIMPKDWKEGKLGDIAEFNKRKVGPKFSSPIQYLDTGHLTEGVVEGYQQFNPDDKIPSSARRYVGEGDILFSLCRPNMRHYGLMMAPPTDIVASTGFAVITASWSGYRYYIYQWLKQDGIIDNIHAVAEQSSTTYPTIDVDYLASMNMVIPSIADTEQYALICRDLYSKIDSNYQESLRLAKLRDTLLPKLMKGEIEL